MSPVATQTTLIDDLDLVVLDVPPTPVEEGGSFACTVILTIITAKATFSITCTAVPD